MDNFIFEIDDYRGIPVRLSRSVWQDKILSDSPTTVYLTGKLYSKLIFLFGNGVRKVAPL